MKFCYHSFLRWLSLWLSPDVSMYEHLSDASYDDLVWEFWQAIAPYQGITSPWCMRQQVKWAIAFGSLDRLDALNSTRTYLDFIQHDF